MLATETVISIDDKKLTAALLHSLNVRDDGFKSTRGGYALCRFQSYDPRIGRFMRLDPYAGDIGSPQSLHKYLYVHDDPVNFIDPTGMFFTSVGGLGAIGIGSLIAGISGGVGAGTFAALGGSAAEGFLSGAGTGLAFYIASLTGRTGEVFWNAFIQGAATASIEYAYRWNVDHKQMDVPEGALYFLKGFSAGAVGSAMSPLVAGSALAVSKSVASDLFAWVIDGQLKPLKDVVGDAVVAGVSSFVIKGLVNQSIDRLKVDWFQGLGERQENILRGALSWLLSSSYGFLSKTATDIFGPDGEL